MPAYEKAQEGLALMKQAVVDLLNEYPEGLRNVDIASALGIRSDHEGNTKRLIYFQFRDTIVSLTSPFRLPRIHFFPQNVQPAQSIRDSLVFFGRPAVIHRELVLPRV